MTDAPLTELVNAGDDFDWRRRAEEERDLVFELTGELLIIAGRDGFLRRVSRACLRTLGWTIDELLSRPWLDLFCPADQPAARAALAGLVPGRTAELSTRVACRDGSWRSIAWRATLTSSGDLCAVGHDATAEAERMQATIDEKAMLVREIHHRVKNNLAVIASQLYLQSTYATDASTIRMLNDMRDRVRSMTLVHDALHASNNLASIDAAAYLRDVSRHLLDSYRSPLFPVALAFEVPAMELPVEAAITCGLIVTELLTNCLKHAFEPGHAGRITLALQPVDGAAMCLRIADNGRGLPADLDVASSNSMGLRLVRSLAKQLEARLEVESTAAGTSVCLTFVPDAGTASPA